MNEKEIKNELSDLPLGGIRYYSRVGSTNDSALTWASAGAPDLSLVVTDEQVSGRGRNGRTWYTPAGAALAFSLIMRPDQLKYSHPVLVNGLGALAVVDVLDEYSTTATIKWPNDVLIGGRKVSGILVDAVWSGEKLASIVLGVGVNVRPDSIPPQGALSFPATCIETETGRRFHRVTLLKEILTELLKWRSSLAQNDLISIWEKRLAYRGMQVDIIGDQGQCCPGKIAGLEPDGSLRLVDDSGCVFKVCVGDVHLRPVI